MLGAFNQPFTETPTGFSFSLPGTHHVLEITHDEYFLALQKAEKLTKLSKYSGMGLIITVLIMIMIQYTLREWSWWTVAIFALGYVTFHFGSLIAAWAAWLPFSNQLAQMKRADQRSSEGGNRPPRKINDDLF